MTLRATRKIWINEFGNANKKYYGQNSIVLLVTVSLFTEDSALRDQQALIAQFSV